MAHPDMFDPGLVEELGMMFEDEVRCLRPTVWVRSWTHAWASASCVLCVLLALHAAPRCV
jgi:hypothetical protein